MRSEPSRCFCMLNTCGISLFNPSIPRGSATGPQKTNKDRIGRSNFFDDQDGRQSFWKLSEILLPPLAGSG